MATTTNLRKRNTTAPKVGANEMGKLPPQAPELEESVLGALMIEKDAYATIADLLRPESFYMDSNACIFEAIRTLAAQEAPIDVLSVVEQLKFQGDLEKMEKGTVLFSKKIPIHLLTNLPNPSIILKWH